MKQRHARLIGLPTSIADYDHLLETLLKDESDKLNEEVIRIYVSIILTCTLHKIALRKIDTPQDRRFAR